MTSGFPKSIGNPARSALEHAGYTRLEDLASVPEGEVASLHGVGPKALGILEAALTERGLAFSFPGSISAPALRALSDAGYKRLEQLAGASEGELATLHGVGPKVLSQLRDALAARGLSLGEGSLRGNRGAA